MTALMRYRYLSSPRRQPQRHDDVCKEVVEHVEHEAGGEITKDDQAADRQHRPPDDEDDAADPEMRIVDERERGDRRRPGDDGRHTPPQLTDPQHAKEHLLAKRRRDD